MAFNDQKDLLNELIKIHSRFSFDRYYSDESSQFCTMWSINDPPDQLEATDPIDAICDLIEINIDEEYAVKLYDMTLKEAAESLYNFLRT
jgi:hypothetical protein